MNTPTSGYANRPLWQVVLLCVVIAAVIGAIYYALMMGSSNSTTTNQTNTMTDTNQPSTAATNDVNAPTSSTNSPSSTTNSKLTYAQARALADYRFQFDKNCRGTTSETNFGALNVKQGSQIMFENHGEKSQVLALGNDAHTVAAGGFILVKAPAVTKTTGLYITCDGGGAGNVFVNP